MNVCLSAFAFPETFVMMLNVLADDRASRTISDDVIDLVLSGPETLGEANRDTSVVIRELFSNANDSVLIAGYAIYKGKVIFKELADRMKVNPNLHVQMFLDIHRKYRDTTKSLDIVHEFMYKFKNDHWPGKKLPELYYQTT